MKRKKTILIILSQFILIINFITAQSNISGLDATDDIISGLDASNDAISNIEGFRGITIGMDIEEVKNLLLQDSYFFYRGDPDIYILPLKEQTLIECDGASYIKRAYFQFIDKKLFIMIISLNQEIIDYYSLYTTLNKKYSEPASFSPEKVTWNIDNILLTLEKPITVKYIDSKVFNSIKQESQAEIKTRNLSLRQFLDEF